MKKYEGDSLENISYPLGGIGAGMICICGNGSLSSISVRNRPNINFEPNIFSVLTVKDENNKRSKVIEAPVAKHKIFSCGNDSGLGLSGKDYGLPRFIKGEFASHFPFASITLGDDVMPVSVEITAWSPFIPNGEDRSSYPFAALEYNFKNIGGADIEAVYYFNSVNFMKIDGDSRVRAIKGGFVLEQSASEKAPYNKGAFCACINDEDTYVDTAWFRGGWFDTMTMLWNGISAGQYQNKEYPDSERGTEPGGTIAVPFKLKSGENKKIKLKLSWFVPDSDLNIGDDSVKETYKPWYTSVFSNINECNDAWCKNYNILYRDTRKFTNYFYDTTLPDEIIEAVAANLSILKSPTILRQADGRLWGWEGCCDTKGSCHGSCTHVWNYAQTICNLFPRLERGLRQTEFYDMQDDLTGHQEFRAYLPIRKAKHTFRAASDGQLGGIIKVYRDWRICGDNLWLKTIWPRVCKSLNYCIKTWDPDRNGVLTEPHHNTYDIEFWGVDAMCSSFYLGALKAACKMAQALGEKYDLYSELYKKGRSYVENNLYNGEYFYQKVMYRNLHTKFSYEGANTENKALLEREGPKYQYATGCLSDSVVGVWLSEISGLDDIIDDDKLRSDLLSIYKYNYKENLSSHANPQRPGYALGNEAGLLLCTWPKGGKPSLPFVYSDEVWTGIEYQVASHLLIKGYTKEALDIVRSCRRRYDGTVRNPFDEYECGNWYARAMASYSLIFGFTGVRYDNIEKTLYVRTNNSNSYKSFISTETGYGTVEVDGDNVSVDVASGFIDIEKTIVE
ncbi:MAG: GH116 family glycosyl hydrolase [Clostridiales bacterium]|nr:GH116 family glycosyl hydrolase [Clostridiales bacterium]